MLPRKGDLYTLEDIQWAIAENLIESETLEYKADPGGKLETTVAKAVCALANTGGGNLVLGLGETTTGEPILSPRPGLPEMTGVEPTAERIDRIIRTKIVPNPRES